jgi:hypothetical protein
LLISIYASLQIPSRCCQAPQKIITRTFVRPSESSESLIESDCIFNLIGMRSGKKHRGSQITGELETQSQMMFLQAILKRVARIWLLRDVMRELNFERAPTWPRKRRRLQLEPERLHLSAQIGHRLGYVLVVGVHHPLQVAHSATHANKYP